MASSICLHLSKVLPRSVQTTVDYFDLMGCNFEYCWSPVLNLNLKWKVEENVNSHLCGRSKLHFLSTWEVSDFQNLSYMKSFRKGNSAPLLLELCCSKSRFIVPESRKVTFYLAGLCTCFLDNLSMLNIIKQNTSK